MKRQARNRELHGVMWNV